MTVRIITDMHGVDSEAVLDGVRDLLTRTDLCSIATTNKDGSPHINTCYFAFDSSLSLIVLTPPSTIHGQNVKRAPVVAVNVFQSGQDYVAPKRGLQLFGRMQEVHNDDLSVALEVYSRRFEAMRTAAPTVDKLLGGFESRLFRITTERFKIFDEPRFGFETWISANVQM